MENCFSSLRSLYPVLLATLLLLIYGDQSLYSDALRPILILKEEEVTTLREVVSKLNQQPLPLINKFLCFDKSIGIGCNCRMKPKVVCDDFGPKSHDFGHKSHDFGHKTHNCRAYTTCCVRSIYLSGQQLNGEIASSIKDLPCLEDLDLSSNYLVGTIPKELSSLKKLKKLILYRNFLTGPIPKELGAMPSLLQMDLGGNRLSGKIPEELGNIVSLRYLTLTSNQLEGELPTQLGKLVNLRTLALADNAFSGTLPELFNNFSSMQDFDVMGNNFVGPLPNYIWKWQKLSSFNLLGNKFEGPLEAISHSGNLVSLMISDLIDTRGNGFPFPDISKLKSLRTLILRKCSIVGEINTHIGDLPFLRNIDLSFNNLTGALPEKINQLQLDSIYLTGNNFNGSIPSWDHLANMNADFSHNNFSKMTFKYSLENSSHLNLYACCNPTTPNLFEWEKRTFTCPTKEPKNTRLFINCGGGETSVNDNNYEADLLKNGASTIYVSQNYTWAYSSTGSFLGSGGGLTGYVQKKSCLDIDDAPLYTTARISPMSLKYYGLCLKNDDYTVKLYFNEIVFTDDTDYGVNAKRVFDVFIQGALVLKNFDITKEANGTRKGSVQTFNASVVNNGLEIHFYWAGTGSIYIPPGLYGPLVSAISVTPVPRPLKKLTAGQIVGIAGSTFFVMVLILAFLQKMGWLGKKLSKSDSMAHGGSYNFPQLKEATRNFHPDNKIGQGAFGRVYKGVLPNGRVIAVKELVSNSKEGKKAFLNEVATVTSLDHPNLVKLLGYCWENNQLLLVYEYMENNSLHTALFGAGNLNIKSRLDWETRLKICIGIAKGLAFLHEESNLKIIHRGIKPSNVLLDKYLNAKISDFGLAKHHEEQHALVTKVGGTSCYVAPEYAMRGLLTYKADVYSFGVLMLEIVSGKPGVEDKPNDETAYLLDLAFILQHNGKLLELMDPELKFDYNKMNEVERVLNLAMLCTNPAPAVRPKMSKVVSILEGKTELKCVPIVVPSDSDDGFRKASLWKRKSF